MQFLPISFLREVSGYRDRRSITKWVKQSLGIELHKVGKNWCVVEEEYEEALKLRYASHESVIKPKQQYVPKTEAERVFLGELENLLEEK